LPWGSRGNTWYTALTNKCGRLLRCKPKMGLQGVTKERKNMLGLQNVSVCFVPWSIYKIIQNQLFFCIHIVTSWCLKWVCKVGLYHSAQLHCRVFPNSVGFVWNLGAPEISMVYHSVASSNSFQVGVYPHFQAHLDLNV
jgi:hypothetical protein